MKNFRRFLSLIMICILAVLFSTAGCMRESQTGLAGLPAPVVIEIWHYLQGAEADALQAQTQRIMGKHPDVLLKLKYVPETNYANTSYQAGAGGKGPEIFIASREIISQLYERGMLAEAAYVDRGAYPAALAAFQFGGTSFGSPWLTDVSVLYFRSDLTGVPNDLEDLFFNRGGVSLVEADMFSLAVWWSALGGRSLQGGNPLLMTPENLIFLYNLVNWQMIGSFRVDPDAFAAFAEGRSLYMIAGASQAKALTGQGVPWGSIQLSDLVGGQGQPLAGSTLGIANSAIKTTEVLFPAIRLVTEELSAMESVGAMERAGVLIPANAEYYRLSESQRHIFPQAHAALNRAWVLEGNALEWSIFPWHEIAWRKALEQEMTPEEALAYGQEEAQRELTEQR